MVGPVPCSVLWIFYLTGIRTKNNWWRLIGGALYLLLVQPGRFAQLDRLLYLGFISAVYHNPRALLRELHCDGLSDTRTRPCNFQTSPECFKQGLQNRCVFFPLSDLIFFEHHRFFFLFLERKKHLGHSRNVQFASNLQKDYSTYSCSFKNLQHCSVSSAWDGTPRGVSFNPELTPPHAGQNKKKWFSLVLYTEKIDFCIADREQV